MSYESPYVPGTNIRFAWDSTYLGYLKTCPRLYQYMNEGWISKEESIHLRFGTEVHRAFQDYDILRTKRIRHEEALHEVVRELLIRTDNWESDHPKKNRETLVRTIVWYLDDHRNDPLDAVIQSNGNPAVEVPFRFELDYGPDDEHRYVLAGTLDKIFDFAQDQYGKDYKTTWTFWNVFWEPDNQMTLYTLACRIVLGTPVRGMVIDMITFKEKGGIIVPEFKRDVTQRSEAQLEEWLKDLHYWLTQAEFFAKEDYWPMNDTSCGKYGGCRFRDICSAGPSVRQKFLESNFKKVPEEERWNPLRKKESSTQSTLEFSK